MRLNTYICMIILMIISACSLQKDKFTSRASVEKPSESTSRASSVDISTRSVQVTVDGGSTTDVTSTEEEDSNLQTTDSSHVGSTDSAATEESDKDATENTTTESSSTESQENNAADSSSEEGVEPQNNTTQPPQQGDASDTAPQVAQSASSSSTLTSAEQTEEQKKVIEEQKKKAEELARQKAEHIAKVAQIHANRPTAFSEVPLDRIPNNSPLQWLFDTDNKRVFMFDEDDDRTFTIQRTSSYSDTYQFSVKTSANTVEHVDNVKIKAYEHDLGNYDHRNIVAIKFENLNLTASMKTALKALDVKYEMPYIIFDIRADRSGGAHRAYRSAELKYDHSQALYMHVIDENALVKILPSKASTILNSAFPRDQWKFLKRANKPNVDETRNGIGIRRLSDNKFDAMLVTDTLVSAQMLTQSITMFRKYNDRKKLVFEFSTGLGGSGRFFLYNDTDKKGYWNNNKYWDQSQANSFKDIDKMVIFKKTIDPALVSSMFPADVWKKFTKIGDQDKKTHFSLDRQQSTIFQGEQGYIFSTIDPSQYKYSTLLPKKSPKTVGVTNIGVDRTIGRFAMEQYVPYHKNNNNTDVVILKPHGHLGSDMDNHPMVPSDKRYLIIKGKKAYWNHRLENPNSSSYTMNIEEYDAE
ncbi:MAG: hypothetical protein ACRCV0_01415 [Brevinema sp.]